MENEFNLIQHKKSKGNYDFYVSLRNNWGNPFFDNNKDLEENNEVFKKWILGVDNEKSFQTKRKWILNNVKYLKNRKIAYDFKDHAEFLLNIVEKEIDIPNVEDYESQWKKEKKPIKKKTIF